MSFTFSGTPCTHKDWSKLGYTDKFEGTDARTGDGPMLHYKPSTQAGYTSGGVRYLSVCRD